MSWTNIEELKANGARWEKLHQPRPLNEWHEDFGDALWHLMPIDSPPYVGSPTCSDWPFDESDEANLFWTPLPDGNLINENWAATHGEQVEA
jgi:hypothetical protein